MMTVLLAGLQIACMALLKLMSVEYDVEGLSLLFMALIIVTMALESRGIIRNSKLHVIFLLGMCARILVLLIDYYVILMPHSGDANAFFSIAAYNKELAYRLGIYYAWLAAFFEIVGPARLFAQFVNLLLSLYSSLFILKILRRLLSNAKAQALGFGLSCLLPNWIMLSVVLMRESLIVFFLTVSLYAFVLWYQENKARQMVAAIIAMIPAVHLHSGMIVAPIALIGGFVFYNAKHKRIRLNVWTIGGIIVFCAAVLIYITQYGLPYLGDISLASITRNQRYWQTASDSVGSYYLKNLNTITWLDVILHTPIRTFYFFFSPLPGDFRGITDIFVFLVSSVPLACIILYSIVTLCTCKKNKKLLIFLLLIVVACGVVYGWGTIAAGTALRHREKLLPIYAMLLAIAYDSRKTKKLYRNFSEVATNVLEQTYLI